MVSGGRIGRVGQGMNGLSRRHEAAATEPHGCGEAWRVASEAGSLRTQEPIGAIRGDNERN